MPSMCTKDKIINFNHCINLLVKIIMTQSDSLRLVKVDALLDAILLIAADKCSIRHNEFLELIKKGENRLINSRVTDIKRFSCYKRIKNIFDNSIESKF